MYLNNTVVVVDDIGAEENGLACKTTKEGCCRTDRLGHFYFPNGAGQLSSSGEGGDFYRNREDTGIVRLNRRNGATSPLGAYTCEIPDANGVLQNLTINLGKLYTSSLLTFMNVCSSLQLYIIMCMCVHVCIHVHIMCACVCPCACACVYTCVCPCACACTLCVCMCMCMYIMRMHVHVPVSGMKITVGHRSKSTHEA